MASPWVKYHDDEDDVDFYFNTVTQKSVYTRPPDYISAASSSSSSDSSSGSDDEAQSRSTGDDAGGATAGASGIEMKDVGARPAGLAKAESRGSASARKAIPATAAPAPPDRPPAAPAPKAGPSSVKSPLVRADVKSMPRAASGATGRGTTSDSGQPPVSEKTLNVFAAALSSAGAARADSSEGKRLGKLATFMRKANAKAASSGGIAKKLLSIAKTSRSRAEVTQNLNLSHARALPVRELLMGLYRMRRDTTMREGTIFALWMVVFAFIVFTIYDVHTVSTTNDAMIDLFLDEEFPDTHNFKKNYYDVMVADEVWQWIRGPMMAGLYPTEWYNDKAYTPAERGYVSHYMRLVGGVQFRQARVDNSSCESRRFLSETLPDPVTGKAVPRFDTKDGTCYSEFDVARQAKEWAYRGPGDTWSDGWHELQGLYGYGPSYGTGGFIAELPADNATRAQEMVDAMFEGLWIDSGTRAVAVSWNMYNTQTRMLTTVRILFEFFETAYLAKSYKIYSFQLVVYRSATDKARAAAEVLFFGFYVYFIYKQARGMANWNPWWAYPFKPSHTFEITLLVLYGYLLTAWFKFITASDRDYFTVEAAKFHDYYNFALSFMDTITLAGFIGTLSSLKLFKYLALNKKMAALWITLGRATPDLFAFAVGFIVLVGGFSVLAMLLYGHNLLDFHNFASSMSNLLRLPFGDYDYDAFSQARPQLTSVFFALYISLVFLGAINIIIAILSQHWTQVSEELAAADKWKLSVPSYYAVVWARCSFRLRRWTRRCRTAVAKRNAKRLVGTDDAPGHMVQNPINAGTKASRPRAKSKYTTRYTTLREAEQAVVRAMIQEEEDGRLMQASWRAEAEFYEALRLVSLCAVKQRNLDLFVYLDRLMVDAASDHMYLAEKELRWLIYKYPEEELPQEKDVAAMLVNKYQAWKSVTIVGEAVRHKPLVTYELPETLPDGTALRKYPVTKINARNARAQARIVAIDRESGLLLNFTRAMLLKKKLPLIQLLQIERDTSDPRKLTLVFSSHGAHGAVARSEPIDKLLETVYVLIFTTTRDREAFQKDLLLAQGNMDQLMAASTGAVVKGARMQTKRNSIGTRIYRKRAEQHFDSVIRRNKVEAVVGAIHGEAGTGPGSSSGGGLQASLDEGMRGMRTMLRMQQQHIMELQRSVRELTSAVEASRSKRRK